AGLCRSMPFLLGLALLGGYDALRTLCDVRSGVSAQQRSRFLLLWTLAGLLLWSGGTRAEQGGGFVTTFWEAFRATPLIILASLALLGLVERRISFRVALITLLLNLAAVGWSLRAVWSPPGLLPDSTPLLIASCLVAALALWQGIRYWRAAPGRR